jgi:hypothetical protein
MATTPTLRTRMNTEAQANNAVSGWSQTETAVEILKEAIATGTTGGATAARQDEQSTKLDTLHSDLAGSVPAGTAIIGKVGIDQTTDGTTNLVVTKKPSVTQVVSTALEASHILKSSAGNLIQLSVFNSKASAQFILLINSTTVPSDGAVTLLYPPIPIGAVSLLVLDLPTPLVASTGIAVSNSSTGTFTKTIGSSDCAFYAQVN